MNLFLRLLVFSLMLGAACVPACLATNPAAARAAVLWDLDTSVVSLDAYSAIATTSDRVFVAFIAARFTNASGANFDEGKIISCPLPFTGDASACTSNQLLPRQPSPVAPSFSKTGRSLSMSLYNGAPIVAYFKGYGVCVRLCSSPDCTTISGTCYNDTVPTSTLSADNAMDYQIAVVVSSSGAKGFFVASFASGLHFVACVADCSSVTVTRVNVGGSGQIASLAATIRPTQDTLLGLMLYDEALQGCTSPQAGGIAMLVRCVDLACSDISYTMTSSQTASAVPTCSFVYRQPLVLSYTTDATMSTARLIFLDYTEPSGIATLNCQPVESCTTFDASKATPPSGPLYLPQAVESTIIGTAADNLAAVFISLSNSGTGGGSTRAYSCASDDCATFTSATDWDLITAPRDGGFFNEEFALTVVDPAAKSFVASFYTSPASSPYSPKSFALQYSVVLGGSSSSAHVCEPIMLLWLAVVSVLLASLL